MLTDANDSLARSLCAQTDGHVIRTGTPCATCSVHAAIAKREMRGHVITELTQGKAAS